MTSGWGEGRESRGRGGTEVENFGESKRTDVILSRSYQRPAIFHRATDPLDLLAALDPDKGGTELSDEIDGTRIHVRYSNHRAFLLYTPSSSS